MARKTQLTRVRVLAIMLCGVFLLLGLRLVDLQVFRHDELKEIANVNIQREFLKEPRRGDILDVNGNLLASSVIVKTVCADPRSVGTNQVQVARVLAPLLGMSEQRLVETLTPQARTVNGVSVTNAFVRIMQKVPVDTWNKVQSAMNGLSFVSDESRLSASQRAYYRNVRKSVFARDEQQRIYPNQTLAAHVLGYTGREEMKIGDVSVAELRGREGVERTFNEKLAGYRGWLLTETDKRKREVLTGRDQDVQATDGLNVVLTIDSVIQHILEAALADAMEKHSPISASGLVIRPATGEILAMATLPTFDPNAPGNYSPDSRRNRTITDIAEPGSTFKVVVVSAALDRNIVKLSDAFDCEHGRFLYGGRVLHDHESYGMLTTEQIITKSSNIGAAKVGLRLGENDLYNYMMAYGFGQPTGVPLPGEVAGIVHPVRKWSKVSIAQIPMGHGVSVSRMQMTMAMSAIANHGLLMRPMLVRRLQNRDGSIAADFPPQPGRRVISEKAAANITQALKTVVGPDGTAPKAALQNYFVAGKTGTAEKVENGRYVKKYFSSFIGFFPADQPELCISITLDEPRNGYYGGQTAAPVFKQVAERTANYLNIRPDRTPDIAAQPDPGTLRTAAVETR